MVTVLTVLNHGDRAHMITMEMFTKGFYVLGFDRTPDRDGDEEHKYLPRQGNVRVKARFIKPHAFCMLNFSDTLKSTAPETLQ